jgi:hypothetical protein
VIDRIVIVPIAVDEHVEWPKAGFSATISLDRVVFDASTGINGSASEDGPWIRGFGVSPEEALADAQLRLGRAVCRLPLSRPTRQGFDKHLWDASGSAKRYCHRCAAAYDLCLPEPAGPCIPSFKEPHEHLRR